MEKFNDAVWQLLAKGISDKDAKKDNEKALRILNKYPSTRQVSDHQSKHQNQNSCLRKPQTSCAKSRRKSSSTVRPKRKASS